MNNNLPDGWKQVRLGQLIAPAYGRGLSKNNRISGQYVVYGSNGQIGTHNEPFTSAPCIIIGRKGSIGEVCFSDAPCCPIDTAYYVDKFPAELLPEYLYYFLKSSNLRALNRAAAIPSLLRPDLEAVEIPLPSAEEQRRIVNRIKECMSRVDEMRRLRLEALQEAQQLEVAMLNEIQARTSAEVEPLEDVILSTQNGFSLHTSEKDNNGFVLTLAAVRTLNLNYEKHKPVQLTDDRVEKYGIRQGDVFISRANTIDLVGLSAVAIELPPHRMIFPDLLIRLTPDSEKVLPEYLTIALRFPSVRKQIKSYARGSSQSMVKISGTSLRKVQIPVPGMEEQCQIVDRFMTLQRSAQALITSQEMDSIDYLPRAVLLKAFAGEL